MRLLRVFIQKRHIQFHIPITGDQKVTRIILDFYHLMERIKSPLSNKIHFIITDEQLFLKREACRISAFMPSSTHNM